MKQKALLMLFILSGGGIFAQNTDALNTFTPYSIFGLGELTKQGTSFNKGMGGIGVGISDKRYINYINPASLVFRDTLSFMADFGVEQKNIYSADGTTTSAFNTFNMHHFVLSFPIYHKSAMMLGISPFSDVGYKFSQKETDPEVINTVGDIIYQKYGTGGISKAFIGGAMKIGKNFSAGLEADYYFGTIDRHSNIVFNTNPTYRNIVTGWDYVLGFFGGKAGLQFNKKLNEDYSFTAGATYSIKTALKGDVTRYARSESSGGTIDTVYSQLSASQGINIPAEIALGASLTKGEKWIFGADFAYQNWSGTKFPEATSSSLFKPGASTQFKIGFEYTPNRYDIRYYFKRCSYRAGFYYDRSYINIGSNSVKSTGVTLGINMPIFQLHNALGLAVDMGQRGSLQNNMVREKYIMFVINIHLHDIWFQKLRYD